MSTCLGKKQTSKLILRSRLKNSYQEEDFEIYIKRIIEKSIKNVVGKDNEKGIRIRYKRIRL